MALVTYKCLPDGSGTGGDVTYRLNEAAVVNLPEPPGILISGSVISGKVTLQHQCNVRFEINLPIYTVFNGAKITLYVYDVSGSSAVAFDYGVLVDDSIWATSSDGWADASYGNSTTYPRMYVSAVFDSTVFQDGNSYSSNINPSLWGARQSLSFGSGTLVGNVNQSGMLVDLQNWFDESESLRDAGVGDGIPFSFALGKILTDPHGSFNFYDEALDLAYVPTLELDYTLNVPSKVCGTANLTPTIEGAPHVRSVIQGAPSIGPSVLGESKLTPSVLGKTNLGPTILGRARIGRC